MTLPKSTAELRLLSIWGCVAGNETSLQEIFAGSTPDSSTNNKPECKESSVRPFKPLLTGSSPVRFANFTNVNAKRSEQSGSQPEPSGFEFHHVHQVYAFLDQLAESTRLERVQSRFESEGRYQFERVCCGVAIAKR